MVKIVDHIRRVKLIVINNEDFLVHRQIEERGNQFRSRTEIVTWNNFQGLQIFKKSGNLISTLFALGECRDMQPDLPRPAPLREQAFQRLRNMGNPRRGGGETYDNIRAAGVSGPILIPLGKRPAGEAEFTQKIENEIPPIEKIDYVNGHRDSQNCHDCDIFHVEALPAEILPCGRCGSPRGVSRRLRKAGK
jgi:hypothetical protein